MRRSGLRTRPVVTLTLLGILAGAGTGAAASETGLSGLAALIQGRAGEPLAEDVPAAIVKVPTESAASRGSTRDALTNDVPSTEAPVVEAPVIAEPTAAELAAAQAAADAAAAAEAAAQSAALAAADPIPAGVSEPDFLAGILSAAPAHEGDGTFFVVPGEVPAPGTGDVKTVRIQVENGLEIDAEKFATLVLATLNDPRSWGGDGSQTFARTASADATFSVSLASPDLVDDLCAPLDTEGLWSCGVERHAVLNSMRWTEGSGIYGDDRVAYREYLVNHEVGHVLGYGHVQCSGRSALADVMVQQSGDSLPCVPNGWPFP
ncbi:DUF3152 domain-containing protein [Sanguibacter sp. 25GB23B1]|uniref:DUF3152 domain-containing protein n=1 Tax=unclassified Sanguibacter TaxID=2645534 RepID=UPI0032AF5AEE